MSDKSILVGPTDNLANGFTMIVPPDCVPAFREAIRRAMNTWQEPPQCIRDLDDIFEFGKVIEPNNIA